jgi:hypothetical protein
MKRIFTNKEQLREAWIGYLSELNTKYHLTIDTNQYCDEESAGDLLNVFLKELNRAIYKGRYGKKYNSIKGFAVREHTYQKKCSFHYHILLAADSNAFDDGYDLPSFDQMNELITKIVSKFRSRAKDNKPKKNYIDDFLLQDYYVDSLEDYLTKNFKNTTLSIKDAGDSICPLGFDNLFFGDA